MHFDSNSIVRFQYLTSRMVSNAVKVENLKHYAKRLHIPR